MRAAPFTRPTIIAAVEFLGERHSQARFNQMVLRLGLENEIPSRTDLSVSKKCDLLGRIVVQRSHELIETVDGSATLAEAVVREAMHLTEPEWQFSPQLVFVRGLARDGYVI